MAISPDVFRAILAMDSYNRGYGADVAGLGQLGNWIGTARVLNDKATAEEQSKSFYAVTYLWNDKKVVSFRGTDDPASDLINGWSTGAGHQSEQGILAAKYVKRALGVDDPFESSFEMTGHSLGGGLAGMLGGLYGAKATVFDNMPFELSASKALGLATSAGPVGVLYERIYYPGASTPHPLDFSQIGGYYVSGEVLSEARNFQDTVVSGLALPDTALNLVQRHSMSLLVVLLYADATLSAAGKSDWAASRSEIAERLFSNSLASEVGIQDAATARDMIAYSAIDVGTRVFGDTGIKALFNDAAQLGRSLAWCYRFGKRSVSHGFHG